ncbi:MAG: retroviral-like aspartic protease family protein [bacterium]
MKFLVSFDPEEDLIYLSAKIFGPFGSTNTRLALDTGATVTMIGSNILEGLGYNLKASTKKVSIVTGSGFERVQELNVQKLQAIDQAVENLMVICHDLPEETGLDGLLGLNFLRHFDLAINWSNSTLSLVASSS